MGIDILNSAPFDSNLLAKVHLGTFGRGGHLEGWYW